MKIPANQLTPQPGLASGGICREPVSVVIGACWMCFDEMTHFLAKHVERWEELPESWERLSGKIRGCSLRCFCPGSKYTMTTVVYIKFWVTFPSGQIVGNQSQLWLVPVQCALMMWFISSLSVYIWNLYISFAWNALRESEWNGLLGTEIYDMHAAQPPHRASMNLRK